MNRLVAKDISNQFSLRTDPLLGAYVDWNGRKMYQSNLPVKVYQAVLSQTGTSNPTVAPRVNTIGALVWTRTGAGTYTAVLAGAFPDAAKMWYPTLVLQASAAVVYGKITRTDANTLTLTTHAANGNAADLEGSICVEVHITA